ncbi:MAG: hypothetical protein H6993_12010 [Pseudomonadales bacterium]|nr:hypothetical protein [Pseudomonadales bacterium]MCP5184681.1 hypothetical protein [Pseudomonadales bacterium]
MHHIVILGLLASCVYTTAVAAPRAWCLFETDNVSLHTNHRPTDAVALMKGLAALRAYAEPLLPPRATPSHRVSIVALRSSRAFRRLFGQSHATGLLLPTIGASTIVLGADPDALTGVGFHEYIHYLQRLHAHEALPPWLDEGTATLLSRLRFEPHAHWARPPFTGTLPPARVVAINALSELAPEDLPAFYNSAQRLAAWALFRADATQRASLLAPVPADGRLRPTIAVLARRAYADSPRRLPDPVIGAVPDDPPTLVRCLDATASKLLLAEPLAALNPSRVAQHLDGIETTAADVLRSRAAEILGDGRLAVTLAQRASAAGDVAGTVQLALLQLSDCLADRPACTADWQAHALVLRRLIQTHPDNYPAVYGLGLAFLFGGQPGDARRYLQVAYRHAPWSPRVNYFLGEALRLTGDGEAVRYLTNALTWAETGAWRARAESALALAAATPDTG